MRGRIRAVVRCMENLCLDFIIWAAQRKRGGGR